METQENYIVAKGMLNIADIHIQQKNYDKAESAVTQAKGMITERYSENHPCVIDFNSNLIEVYTHKPESDALRLKCVKLAEKNAEIANHYYGEDSIFVVKHQLNVAS